MRDAARPDDSPTPQHARRDAPHDPVHDSVHDSVPAATPRSDRRVEEASEDSFPASDPPTFTPSSAGRASRQPAPPTAGPVDLATTTTTPLALEARRWADALVQALDREDLDAIGGLLTEDAVVQWGAGALLVGRRAALLRVDEWFRMSGPLERHVIDVRGDADAVFIELEVRGHRDGRATQWPEAVSARLRQGAASRVTVYGALPGEPTGREASTDASAAVPPSSEHPDPDPSAPT